MCIFSSILNSIMEGWKYRSKEVVFKSYFLSPKKPIRQKTFSWNLHDIFFRNLHEMSQPSCQNQQNGKETFLNFFSNLYIAPWLRKSFKFVVLRLLENTFVSQKSEPVHFYLYLFLGSYYYYSRQKEITHFPLQNVFCIFIQQKGIRIMEHKK